MYELGRVAENALGRLAHENKELSDLYTTAHMKFNLDTKQLEAKVKMHASDNQRLMHESDNKSTVAVPASDIKCFAGS